jgi:hypothetical protein
VVGVHTPEFAFERVRANVRENARRLRLRYPIALDNRYGTWNAWHNQYWPAKYLVDRRGHVRWFHFGEGDYAEAEETIRTLLADHGVSVPVASGLDEEPSHQLVTPESYLGYERLARYYGPPVRQDEQHTYAFPASRPLQENELAFAGRWRFEDERAIAGRDARLRLRYRARDVYLVLTGAGTVRVLVDGKPERTVRVRGDRLYTLVRRPKSGGHLLELRVSRGVAGYAFTFG